MAKLSDNQKSMIILGVGILVAIGAGVFAYLDWGEANEVDLEIETKQSQFAANKKEIDKIPGLKREMVAYQEIVRRNSEILPTEEDLHNLVRDLGQMEKDTGVTIRALPTYNPVQDKAVSAIDRIPMKLQLLASTRALLRFLNALENHKRLISVTRVTITPSGADTKGGEELRHDVAIDFEVYQYKHTAGATPYELPKAEELELLASPEVKKIIETEGKPAFIEKYQLLPGREGRRDLFVDPRRRVGPESGAPVDTEVGVEEAVYQTLELKLEKALLELDAYRTAEQRGDFLLQAANKRHFLKAKEDLEEDLRKVSKKNPEFDNRDLQDRYTREIKPRYQTMLAEAADVIGGEIAAATVSEKMAEGMLKDMKELMDNRMFDEANEKWLNVDLLVREAKGKVESGARPHLDAMRKLGEHARFQSMLAKKQLTVQGVVRMEHTSAVIVNGKTLFPGKAFDKDLVFRRVEEGDRIIFTIEGHEVDLVPPRPQLLKMERAYLEQE